MRVACAVSDDIKDALELYDLFSRLEYLTSSPTLFNAGTRHQQLSSCFLLDSPTDSLDDIYNCYSDIAMLSNLVAALAYHTLECSHGSHIRSTNGRSNGIIPWLKTLDASVAAVNQGGSVKAPAVSATSLACRHHGLPRTRDNTGDEARQTYNLNLSMGL